MAYDLSNDEKFRKDWDKVQEREAISNLPMHEQVKLFKAMKGHTVKPKA